MSALDGKWNVTVKTPIGDQQGMMDLRSDGARFTAQLSGDLGTKDISGTVDGNVLVWQMDISKPMPISLDCKATVDGDRISGGVSAGFFGKFGLSGTRVA